jgi:uncharacterized protein YceH (UPF0502 family)
MEKSKTTPDAYPMTFAALTTGCNQKSNRMPINNYSTEQIEQTVDELRAMGAVTLVQGNGRVEKVRHYAYQWLGLSKVEAAVMTELLLRGEQTLGELRTRASRLEPIADLGELQRMLDELESRNLIVKLTPSGRGQIVSHNIYQESELEQLRKKVAAGGVLVNDEEEDEAPARSPSPSAVRPATAQGAASSSVSLPSRLVTGLAPSAPDHSSEIEELRAAVAKLSARLEHIERELGVTP